MAFLGLVALLLGFGVVLLGAGATQGVLNIEHAHPPPWERWSLLVLAQYGACQAAMIAGITGGVLLMVGGLVAIVAGIFL